MILSRIGMKDINALSDFHYLTKNRASAVIKIDVMKLLIVGLAFLLTNIYPLKAKSQAVDTMVDAGGYKLHFNIIKGSGVPILFESGGGHDGTVWNDIVKRLHGSTNATLITYDRAGMGKSGIDTTHITILGEVQGLQKALKNLGYTKSIFLVAHSFGGAYATLFGSKAENRVKGAVLIDITLSCFMTPEKAKEMTEPYKKELLDFKEKTIGTYYLLLNYVKSTDLLRNTHFPSTIPATVISSDSSPYTGRDSIVWKSCQKSFGELPYHHYIMAEETSHYVYLDNPELVTNEILKLYNLTSVKKKR